MGPQWALTLVLAITQGACLLALLQYRWPTCGIEATLNSSHCSMLNPRRYFDCTDDAFCQLKYRIAFAGYGMKTGWTVKIVAMKSYAVAWAR